jgi:hypothetical protein
LLSLLNEHNNEHSSFTAWTTRVSNPVCSPCFRTSASVKTQKIAFALGVPSYIYEFYLSTRNSTFLYLTLVNAHSCNSPVEPVAWTLRHKKQPTCPLRPVIPNNTRPPCITAAAGTELAGASSSIYVIIQIIDERVLQAKLPFFTHAILLDQACAQCPKFPTAASRRSLGRVSVPVWPIIRKDQLSIIGLVSHYHTNYLILRGLIKQRIHFICVFILSNWNIYSGLGLNCLADSHVLLTRSLLCKHSKLMLKYSNNVQLACVKHIASVHSEPGSNSFL